MKLSRSKTIALIFGAFSIYSFYLAVVDFEQYQLDQNEMNDFSVCSIGSMQVELWEITLILGCLCAIAVLYFLLFGKNESRQNYKIVPSIKEQ